jgi:hypothetical protein
MRHCKTICFQDSFFTYFCESTIKSDILRARQTLWSLRTEYSRKVGLAGGHPCPAAPRMEAVKDLLQQQGNKFGGDNTLAGFLTRSQRCHKTANIPACLTRGVGGRRRLPLLPCRATVNILEEDRQIQGKEIY